MGEAQLTTTAKMTRFLKKVAKYVYWIVGLIVLVGGCYILYNKMEKPVAAVLLFLGGIQALYFYWVKWFIIPEVTPDWPPYTTPCPDFLTLVDPGDGDTKPAKCMDFVGVSANGQIKRTNPEAAGVAMNNPDYTLEIARKYRDSNTGQTVDVKLGDICDLVRSKGLTWLTVCPE